MKAKKRRRTLLIVGLPFQLGFDSRRHILTREEKQRGGRTTWKRYMRGWRGELGLPGGEKGKWWGENLQTLTAGSEACNNQVDAEQQREGGSHD